MEYWQDLYHELEQQKERGLREGKREGMIDGAQQAFMLSFLIFLMLLLSISVLKENITTAPEKIKNAVLDIYHFLLIGGGSFLLVRALMVDKVLIGNLSLEEARTEGTKRAYIKSWALQRDRYQSIWFALVILLNSIVYWMISTLFNSGDLTNLLVKEVNSIIAMIVLNIVLVIILSVLKR